MSVENISCEVGMFPLFTLALPSLKKPVIRFGINRTEENELVRKYQRSKNEAIFNELFDQRRVTFKNLAAKYRYLDEDAESEIMIIFHRAIERFEKNGCTSTDFNTFFYTLVRNHFSNRWRRNNRRKRTLESGDRPEDSMLSLDYRKDEDGAALYEVIADETPTSTEYEMQDCLEAMSQGNPMVMKMLEDLLSGTRRQYVVNDHYYAFTVSMQNGNPFHSIRTAIELPTSTYEIEDFICRSEEVEFCLRVRGKNFVQYLADVFKEKIVVPAY